MVKSSDAVLFAMHSGPVGRRVEAKAVLSATQSKGFNGKPGWRAVIRIHGVKQRIFGSWRESFVESVRACLHTYGHRVSASEQYRLLTLAPDLQARRTAALSQAPVDVSTPGEVSTAALSQAPVDAHAPSQGHGRQNAVRLVHQVYGIFRDDKPMSVLFEASHKQWKEVATLMSAHYHLWNADEVEALIKNKYAQHWDMYCSVRYPIMRCDIARLIILHAYGGLYADLDTMPNREWYEHAEFALARVKDPKKTTLSAPAKRKEVPGYQPSEKGEGMYLEMEIIVSTRGNDIFIRWLDHMRAEIQSKEYAKKGFWKTAKMRYVYQTTGPASLSRFLKLPSNATSVRTMKYLEMNQFKEAEKLTTTDKRCFDVISYESNSYFTKEHEIIVPVGPGDTTMPAIPVLGEAPYRRLRFKCNRSKCARFKGARQDDPIIDVKESTSQEDANVDSVKLAAPAAAKATTNADSVKLASQAAAREAAYLKLTGWSRQYARAADGLGLTPADCLRITSRAATATRVADDDDSDALSSACNAVGYDPSACNEPITSEALSPVLAEKLKVLQAREVQLREFFKTHSNGAAAKVILQSMPDELEQWITADQQGSNYDSGVATPELRSKSSGTPGCYKTPPRRIA